MVLRSLDELEGDGRRRSLWRAASESEAAKLHVMLFDEDLPAGLKLTGVAGDYRRAVASDRPRNLHHRLPQARRHLSRRAACCLIEKQLPKGTLVTSRNWNTILKAIA